MGFLFSKILRNIVIAYIIFSGVQYLLRWKSYNFSPKEFRSIASKSQGLGNGMSVSVKVSADLRKQYGALIQADSTWHPISGGGLNLRTLFLHSGLTEYIAIFNAPLATQGRSGVHWSNNTCTVLIGAVDRIMDTPELAHKETFVVGNNFRHGQFDSAVYSLKEDTTVICYGRGIIPTSGLWALSGGISDPFSLGKLAIAYYQGTFNGLAYSLQYTYDKYTKGKTEL